MGVPFCFTPFHHPKWRGWNYREYCELYRKADGIFALTDSEKETLIKLGVSSDKIFVTGTGSHIGGKRRSPRNAAKI